MAVTVISGYDDPEFPVFENFFQNFAPEDWDYMIVGIDRIEVADLAEKLMIFDYQMKEIGTNWVAVTYHS